MTGRLWIGTSGWHYAHWRGRFYPWELASGRWLAFYAGRLSSTEINQSFYGLPSTDQLEAWSRATPDTFLFAAKASRYLTHLKKLKDPVQPLGRLENRLRVLGSKLGPILFQLPPNWRFNADRLQGLLSMLPADQRHVFEFRDHRWINDRSQQLLNDHGAGFCIYELGGFQSPLLVTADFVYLRLHGPHAAYQGSYGTQALEHWATRIREWSDLGLDVYCYFDNDQEGYAVTNALSLNQMLAETQTHTNESNPRPIR